MSDILTNPLAARLRRMGACREAVEWVRARGHTTLQSAWDDCDRADWMLWLVARIDGHYSPRLRLAACACARTALRHVPAGEDRPLRAIETAERYARGEATDDELREARRDAAAVAVAAADAYAYSADADACAYSAYADACADAADAYAAVAVADAYACAADAAGRAAARMSAQREMAALVRGIIPAVEVSR